MQKLVRFQKQRQVSRNVQQNTSCKVYLNKTRPWHALTNTYFLRTFFLKSSRPNPQESTSFCLAFFYAGRVDPTPRPKKGPFCHAGPCPLPPLKRRYVITRNTIYGNPKYIETSPDCSSAVCIIDVWYLSSVDVTKRVHVWENLENNLIN